MPKKKTIKRKHKAIKHNKKQQNKKKPKKVKVKKNRRSQAKYPALEKKYNLLSRQEKLDFDYIGKLNDREKRWLNKFVEEEINASFKHKNPLNKSKKAKRTCYNRNNANNRDVLTRYKAQGNVEELYSIKEASEMTPESYLIEKEEVLFEELENLDNTFDRAENSEDPTKQKN